MFLSLSSTPYLGLSRVILRFRRLHLTRHHNRQTWYWHALWISAVCHGLAFTMPLPQHHGSSDARSQPDKTITLATLLAPIQPQKQPTPASSEQPHPLPQSPDPHNPEPALQPQQAESFKPPAHAISPTPIATPASTPTPTPTPTPAPTDQPDQAGGVQTFLEQLATTTGVPGSPPEPDLFPQPNLYFASEGAEPILKPAILRAVWIDGQNPGQVYISVLSSQLQSSHFQTEQKSDYGDGVVYKIQQGNIVWYLNLVPSTQGNGTIIVVWNDDPSHPTSESRS